MSPEEVEIEKAMRLEKSRLSARDGRLRRKGYVGILHEEINELELREARSKKSVAQLKLANKNLQDELNTLKRQIQHPLQINDKQAHTTTVSATTFDPISTVPIKHCEDPLPRVCEGSPAPHRTRSSTMKSFSTVTL